MTVGECQGVIRADMDFSGYFRGNQGRLGITQWVSGNSPGIQGLPSGRPAYLGEDRECLGEDRECLGKFRG